MPARYSTAYRLKTGILKQNRTPHDEWHMDWAMMGQQTLGLGGRRIHACHMRVWGIDSLKDREREEREREREREREVY
jgi:hypothetical protein